MKKYKNILLVLFISLGIILQIPNIYANEDIVDVSEIDLSDVEIGDEFSVEHNNDTYIYRVSEDDTDRIYIGEKKNRNILDIDHFEVDVYEEEYNEDSIALTSRKFVKLEELCDEEYIETEDGKSLNLCQATTYEVKNKRSNRNSTIRINRQYVNNISDTVKKDNSGTITYEALDREVHYITETTLGSDEFQSILYLSGTNEFNLDDVEEFEDFDCDENEELCYTFGGSEARSDRLSKKGVLTGDVETLVDENGDIFVSLRFLSEALGARVDWLPQEVNENTDAVLIRFYDSDEYCKELDIEFNENNKDFEGMYQEFIEALKGKENDMSFDLQYTYWDGDEEETENVEWNKLFLGGYAANKGYVFWDYNKEKILFQYNANKSEESQDVDFQEICPSENYDSNGQLKNLDGCIEVMGIIRYYGVPVPINLLREENDTCKFDNDYFEDSDNYYDDNYDDDNDYDSDYEDIVYVVGDTHVKNIKDLDIVDDDYEIVFKYAAGIKKFENLLDDLIDEINNSNNTDETYQLIFNIGNTEILDIINEYDSVDDNVKKVKKEIQNLADDYAELYNNFINEIDSYNSNINIHIISNTPIQNDENDFVEAFNDYLSDEIDNNFELYDLDNIKFEYENDLEYTEDTYEEIIDEILDELGLN
ncbi:MAG: hypothetical protein IJO57_02830 [Bacilli bacterium]|nr:hypothetical protein [Bacilli bacterium]